MICIDQAGWDEGWNNNKDPYGRRCFTYARDWADLMEAEIQQGKKLEDVAEETSKRADYDGITGFMYGMAVAILCDTWVHGQQLRVWHNAKWGNPDAKEVINPALVEVGVFTVGLKDDV